MQRSRPTAFVVTVTALTALAACGDSKVAGPTEPERTAGTTVTTVSGETGPDTVDRPITIDDIEIDPDAAPAGPLFGGASAATDDGGGGQESEPATVAEACQDEPCDPDIVDPEGPDEGPIVLPEHQPFCSLLAEMEQRPYPDDEFEQLIVAHAWFQELGTVVPGEIAQPLLVLTDYLGAAVASQSVDIEADPDDPVLPAFEQISGFIETSC